MTQRMEIYKCQICGNIVEVIHAAGGELVCCGQPMNLLVAGATDAAVEKHVPVVEKVDGGFKVSVGSVAHPMGEDHLIEWIELIDGDSIQRAYLSPSSQPEAFFKSDADSASAREYCNLHGLWKG
jgi:superoxide reductase